MSESDFQNRWINNFLFGKDNSVDPPIGMDSYYFPLMLRILALPYITSDIEAGLLRIHEEWYFQHEYETWLLELRPELTGQEIVGEKYMEDIFHSAWGEYYGIQRTIFGEPESDGAASDRLLVEYEDFLRNHTNLRSDPDGEINSNYFTHTVEDSMPSHVECLSFIKEWRCSVTQILFDEDNPMQEYDVYRWYLNALDLEKEEFEDTNDPATQADSHFELFHSMGVPVPTETPRGDNEALAERIIYHTYQRKGGEFRTEEKRERLIATCAAAASEAGGSLEDRRAVIERILRSFILDEIDLDGKPVIREIKTIPQTTAQRELFRDMESVESLHFSPSLIKAINEVGLSTVGELRSWFTAKGGFEGIPGIDAANSRQIIFMIQEC
jgi:hypothetical protein